MAKERIDLRKELHDYREAFHLIQRVPCSKEQNQAFQQILKNGGKLPDGVFPFVFDSGLVSDEFYTIYKPDLTPEEKEEYLTLKRLSLLKTIKNCVLFFTVLTIVGIIAYLYIMLISM